MNSALALLFFSAVAVFPYARSKPAEAGSKPHIVMIVVDDWGWANVGYHDSDPVAKLATPNIDELANTGLILDQHYTFSVCGPSRASLLSGRLPSNVNLEQSLTAYNYANPSAGGPGVPPDMTTIPQKLKQAGYSTHVVGKWDMGVSSGRQAPEARDFDSSLIFFSHMNDMYTMEQGSCGEYGPIKDFWRNGEPAADLVGTAYEEEIFKDRLVEIISSHNAEDPLFLYYGARLLHGPLQVPQEYVDRFSFILNQDRKLYYAMTSYLDEVIGNITEALQESNLWEDTLLVVTSDNGGPIYLGAGANNYPLKGAKASFWQGGIRVNAFLNGGALPDRVKSTILGEYIHVCDWYATFCHLAGEDWFDEQAEEAGLPPVDSLNVWPLISGQNGTSPRTEFFMGPIFYQHEQINGYALIENNFKILLGDHGFATWTGPASPNITNPNPAFPTEECGAKGCLYDIINDPEERTDLADSKDPNIQKILYSMREKANDYLDNIYNPNRGIGRHPVACQYAVNVYDGFWGPFADFP
eukprot:m.5568 g.5568  ORF g.5568 m.5568 type:complete len:527 (+) comp13516_c0_seq1:166-1746(+)